MNAKYLFLLALAFLLGACQLMAKRASPIPAGMPQATLKFGPIMGNTETLNASWYDNDQCASTGNSGYVGSFSFLVGREGTVSIPAEKQVFVNHVSGGYGGGCGGAGGCIQLASCASRTAFTPMPGARYRSETIAAGNGCRVAVFEITAQGEKLVSNQRPLAPCK